MKLPPLKMQWTPFLRCFNLAAQAAKLNNLLLFSLGVTFVLSISDCFNVPSVLKNKSSIYFQIDLSLCIIAQYFFYW